MEAPILAIIVIMIFGFIGLLLSFNKPNLYFIGLFAMLGLLFDVLLQIFFPWWTIIIIVVPAIALIAFRISGQMGNGGA